jgi:sialate O-acetylesterase
MKFSSRVVSSMGMAVCLTAWTGHSVQADVKLPAIFGDHMVLQQEAKLPVWGTADAGEKVTVTVGDHTATMTAGADGKWRVDLNPFPNGAPATTMTVTGKNTLTFQDVLIGEVWLCSGQSNMWLALKFAHNAKTEIPLANDPQIRLYTVPQKTALEPQADQSGSWQICTPETAQEFSGVGYFFGRELRSTLKRPIGLIGSYYGGTIIQAWSSLSSLEKDPSFTKYVAAHQKNVDDFPKMNEGYTERQAAYEADVKKWNDDRSAKTKSYFADAQKAKTAGQPPPAPLSFVNDPPLPKPPLAPDGGYNGPSNLFNAMIAPLIPYGIKGALWYQGESNGNAPFEYRDLLTRMITDWREKWGEGDFTFLIVQLPNTGANKEWDNGAFFAESQFKVLALPNTGLAVTIDIGREDLHPKDKLDLGLRLALAARHVAYGENIVYSGPTYQSMKVEGGAIRLSFNNVGGGLTTGVPPWHPDNIHPAPTTQLLGFTIAGADKNFVPADAKIEGDTVVVSSPQVPAPVAVRYAWITPSAWKGVPYTFDFNLYNKEGLPTPLFRTDDWPARWQ